MSWTKETPDTLGGPRGIGGGILGFYDAEPHQSAAGGRLPPVLRPTDPFSLKTVRRTLFQPFERPEEKGQATGDD